jgi:hypothetical protein
VAVEQLEFKPELEAVADNAAADVLADNAAAAADVQFHSTVRLPPPHFRPAASTDGTV